MHTLCSWSVFHYFCGSDIQYRCMQREMQSRKIFKRSWSYIRQSVYRLFTWPVLVGNSSYLLQPLLYPSLFFRVNQHWLQQMSFGLGFNDTWFFHLSFGRSGMCPRQIFHRNRECHIFSEMQGMPNWIFFCKIKSSSQLWRSL